MRRWAAYLAALLLSLPGAAAAQDAEADRGFLTEFLEENLSGAGRDVRLTGFAGALSSRATIDEMTFADADGVWLTIRDATISWNRTALLRGRVEVAELTAGEIEVARLPTASADPGLPEPEARPFQLPELPVSVEIGAIKADRVALGEAVFGTAVEVSLDGSLRLSDGDGEAGLTILRIDGTEGALTLAAAFVNATSSLSLSLDLSEPADGIAATLLNLPGRPAIDLGVTGEGTLADFAARIALASEGEDRLAGQVVLREVPRGETAPGVTPPPPTRTFALDLAGDIAPLFLPEYREFFGSSIRLVAAGERVPGGRTKLDRLQIEASAIELGGSLVLAADGLPEVFAFSGRIAAPDGQPVKLPLAGPVTEVREARLEFGFDAARGEDWTGTVAATSFKRGSDRVSDATLRVSGRIARSGEGALVRQVEAHVEVEASGIALADPALAEALGPRLDAKARILWREGQPVEFSDVAAETASARAMFSGNIGTVADALPLSFQGSASLDDLAAFSALAGRPLGGQIVIGLAGATTVLDGRFDVKLGGVGRDLVTGADLLDRVIAGESRVVIDARRDETGITLRQFEIATAGARVEASGLVRTGATALVAEARMNEVAVVVPGLEGPALVEASIRETAPGRYELAASGDAPGGAVLSFAGSLTEAAGRDIVAEGRLTARIAGLAAYGVLAGRDLAGRLAAEVSGRAVLPYGDFDVALELTGEDLGLGQPTADLLLGASASLSASVRREGEVTTIDRFVLGTGEVTADVTGAFGRSGGRIEGNAELRDVGLFAPDFPGKLGLRGTLERGADARWTIDLGAEGPGGTTARVTGSLAETGETVDLALTGEAPLGLANAALAPRAVRGSASIDLAMRGRPGLPALSGRITTSGARLVAPTFGVVVDGIAASVQLTGGSAAIDVSGAVEGGGRVNVAGSVGLSAPNQAALRIGLAGARLTDPDLFETDVSGEITITGPLAGGAVIGGAMDIGTTEVRLAATGLGAGGEVDGLVHRNESARVFETRRRAGFVADAGATGGGQRRPFPIDLVIRAPNRIFIRGRGLDAELGGSLRLRGTTAEVAPQGRFDLIRGRLDILGRRLALDEGFARIEGSFDPYVRLVASTEADGITVRIVVEGPASAPEVRFESEPELPQDEVLARLFFGRGLDELSPLQVARLASAVATLSGRGGGDVVDRLRQNFGLDELDITTDSEGGAGLRAGRYLSENVYTEVNIGADGKSDISINLDLTQSVTVKGSVGSEGETGIGIFLERDY